MDSHWLIVPAVPPLDVPPLDVPPLDVPPLPAPPLPESFVDSPPHAQTNKQIRREAPRIDGVVASSFPPVHASFHFPQRHVPIILMADRATLVHPVTRGDWNAVGQ